MLEHSVRAREQIVTVNGIEITQAQIDACLARMRATEYFRAHEIVGAAYRAGVANEATDRVADRLIQRERKACRIVQMNRQGLWRYTGSRDTSTTGQT